MISKTRKDIWSCFQNSINSTAFGIQLEKIEKPVARIPVRMAFSYAPRRTMQEFDSSDSSSEYEDTDEEESEYYIDHTCHMHSWQIMQVCLVSSYMFQLSW